MNAVFQQLYMQPGLPEVRATSCLNSDSLRPLVVSSDINPQGPPDCPHPAAPKGWLEKYLLYCNINSFI